MNQDYIYPEFFARYYDLIYYTMRDSVDHSYYLGEVLKTEGKVLEIGVGTGRLFSDALKNGSDIYGIDISPAMLDILRSKIPPDQYGRVSCQNMINFSFGQKFKLIVAPFRVFMHLCRIEDQLKTLENICNHLADGGRFIFDTFNPDLPQLVTGLMDFKDFEGEYEPGKKIRRYVTTRPEQVDQVIHIKFRMEMESDTGIKTEEWNTSLRYFFRFELEHLLARSPFGSYQLLGDFDGNRIGENSKEFIVIGKK